MLIIVLIIPKYNVYIVCSLLMLYCVTSIVVGKEIIIRHSFKIYYEAKLKYSPDSEGKATIKYVIYTERNIWN